MAAPRWWLAVLLLALLPAVRAEEAAIRITARHWLEAAGPALPRTDQEILALASAPGKAVRALDEVPYTPFKAEWFVLQLEGPADASTRGAHFRIFGPQRREIDAFLIVDGRVQARVSAGYARASTGTAFTSPDLHLPLEAWTGGRATVLLRCVTTERLPFGEAIGTAGEAQFRAVVRGSFLAFFAGCALVFVAAQLVLYRGLRETASRDYALLLTCAVLVQLNRSGCLVGDLLPGPAALYPGDLHHGLRLVTLLFTLRSCASFLDLKAWSPGLARAVRLAQRLLIGSALGCLLIGPGVFQQLVGVAFLPCAAVNLVVTSVAMKRGRAGALFLLVGWAGLAAAATYANLVVGGVVGLTWFAPFVFPLGMLWEMAFNGAGLILKLQRMQAERQQAQLRSTEIRVLSQLVKVLSHDISNPLSAVNFAVKRIKASLGGSSGDPALAEAVTLAEDGHRAIVTVIDDVRALELLRSSGGILKVSVTDVAALARKSLDVFREAAAQKAIRLADQLPAQAEALAAPGILANSVIANLLSNAIKFTPSGGTVAVALVGEPARVGLRITDAGAGIPAGTVAALEQAEPLPSRPGTAGEWGTGFGLQLARDFVVAMGGSLQFEVRASGPEQGTTVTVWLKKP